MARPKKIKTEGSASLATETIAEAPSNGSSSLPAATFKTFYAESTGTKRKGKAPSEKTQLVRAGLAKNPELSPKALADLLNTQHPGFHFKNNDISQQKLQLKNQGAKKPAKKGKTRKAAATAAPQTAPTPPTQTGSPMFQLASLAKQIGTSKIREVCDLIDHLSK
jgi:hypothetical protein